MEPEKTSLFQRIKEHFNKPEYKVLYILVVITFLVCLLSVCFEMMNVSSTSFFIIGLFGIFASAIFGGSYVFKLIKQLFN